MKLTKQQQLNERRKWIAADPARRADVTLSNGTIIKHRRMNGGAAEAFVSSWRQPEREMTDAEWNEYCAVISKR